MRPLHLRFRYLGLAFLGGAVGTGLRYGLTLLLPGAGQGRGAVLLANVLGAFLLGLLLEGLAMRGPDQGIRRTGRILVGTGLLGDVERGDVRPLAGQAQGRAATDAGSGTRDDDAATGKSQHCVLLGGCPAVSRAAA